MMTLSISPVTVMFDVRCVLKVKSMSNEEWKGGSHRDQKIESR